jgi:hypothetical protein
MKRNFQAIDAIAYAFGYGFKGQATLLRLGWPSFLLYAAGFYFFIQTLAELQHVLAPAAIALNTVMGEGGSFAALWGSVGSSAGTTPLEAAPLHGEDLQGLLQFQLLTFVAGILLIPATTAMIRQSAGASVRSGFLPLFGKPEIYLIAGYVVSYIILVALSVVAGLLYVSALAAAGAFEAGSDGVVAVVAILGGILLALAVLWLVVRLSFLAGHAAVSESLNLGAAWKLTGGRFWKLLGTYILFGLLLSFVVVAVQFAMLAMVATKMWIGVGAVFVVTWLYTLPLYAGFYGRILGDLMVDPENPGPYDDVEPAASGDEDEEGWSSDNFDAEATADFAEPAVRREAQAPGMIRRLGEAPTAPPAESSVFGEGGDHQPAHRQARSSSIGFIRRRFRG